AMPPTQLPQSTYVVTTPGQLLHSTVAAMPSPTTQVPQPSSREFVPSDRSQKSGHRFSQHLVLWVLAALLILGGSLTWLTYSHSSSGSTVNYAPTATSTTAFNPTASPTAMPSPTATPSPTPTPSPTAS